MKKINFKVFYDKKSGLGLGVELPDGTIILADVKENGMRIAFPKKKFKPMFEKQIEEGRKYLEVIFDKKEMDIILKGLDYKKIKKELKRSKKKNDK